MPQRSSALNAVEKVCAILKSFSDEKPHRLIDIADGAGLHKATTLRILTSLIEQGFVQRTPRAKTFELGNSLRAIMSARQSFDLAEIAQPSLLRLAQLSGDTANLSVREDLEAIYTANAVGSHPLQPSYLKVGSRRPLGVGAASLALIAWLPNDEVNTIVDIVCSRQVRGSRITRSFLKERIREARRTGYTVLLDAAYLGMGGIGVPIRAEKGKVIAAMSIGAAVDRIKPRKKMLVAALLAEARHVEKAIVKLSNGGPARRGPA